MVCAQLDVLLEGRLCVILKQTRQLRMFCQHNGMFSSNHGPFNSLKGWPRGPAWPWSPKIPRQPLDTAKYRTYAPGPSGVPKLPQLVGDWGVPVPGSYKARWVSDWPDSGTNMHQLCLEVHIRATFTLEPQPNSFNLLMAGMIRWPQGSFWAEWANNV